MQHDVHILLQRHKTQTENYFGYFQDEIINLKIQSSQMTKILIIMTTNA